MLPPKLMTAIISVYVAVALAYFVMSYRRESPTRDSPDMDLGSALSHLAYGECLLAHSPLPGGVFGMDGERVPRIKHCNQAFARALGYTPEELRDANFLEMLHPDDVRATTSIWGDSAVPIIEAGEGSNVEGSAGFENRYRRKDGGWAHFRWMDVPNPVISSFGSIVAFCELLEVTYEP